MTSQRRTDLLPEANILPEGFHRTALTSPSWASWKKYSVQSKDKYCIYPIKSTLPDRSASMIIFSCSPKWKHPITTISWCSALLIGRIWYHNVAISSISTSKWINFPLSTLIKAPYWRSHVASYNLVIIGSGSSLLPVQEQAMTWTKDHLLSIEPLGIIFQSNFNGHSIIIMFFIFIFFSFNHSYSRKCISKSCLQVISHFSLFRHHGNAYKVVDNFPRKGRCAPIIRITASTEINHQSTCVCYKFHSRKLILGLNVLTHWPLDDLN